MSILYDEEHLWSSPLLGMFFSATVCSLGHDVVEMELVPWDEPWLACARCGARFLPVSVLADDYDVVEV